MVIFGLVVGGGGAFTWSYMKTQRLEAEKRLHEALSLKSREAEQQLVFQGKAEALQQRSDLERELSERRSELTRVESRLEQREEDLHRQQQHVAQQEQSIASKQGVVDARAEELQETLVRQGRELERISSMTSEEARRYLMDKLHTELSQEQATMIRQMEQETRETSERKARSILSQAIQRCAVDHVCEAAVTVVSLPSDDMKGRIIGREGRNIRALEAATGVELIIDDTPEAVVISGFDPVRREIARIALETLVADGRISPTRIEEVVTRAKQEVEDRMKEDGEQAILDVGISGVHPEIIKLIGRLRYRTSYGQNILLHSKEVAYLAGIIAAELKADVDVAKRGALLHDIGKALTHTMDGTHTALGVEAARKYNESPRVIHAIEAHHNDVMPETVEAVIVQVADALSAARPGARREPLETHVKRMQKLEDIAKSFTGIERCFAIQAGREVRVMVAPDKVSDAEAAALARDIAKRIESEMTYPGQVKVTVIRESRNSEFAK
ncbi:MAG: ribonuclease Y [Candidatus Sericytochromatia bacterium]|nr:ribonuclease Y [Candidatus Sericytochromatia bacterium]